MKNGNIASPKFLPAEFVERRIYFIRSQKVMLGSDLAELYQVEVRALVQAVKRNADRFPEDFMFQLSAEEYADLKSHIVISSWGGARRAMPYAFTEHGVAMLSSVLNSKRAVVIPENRGGFCGAVYPGSTQKMLNRSRINFLSDSKIFRDDITGRTLLAIRRLNPKNRRSRSDFMCGNKTDGYVKICSIPMSIPIEKYPWLSIVAPTEKYLRPDYYDRILKEYIFDGKRDIEFLRERAKIVSGDAEIVEFGPGSGRATEVAISAIEKIKKLTLVDLSDWMLAKCQERFADKKLIEYVQSDSVDFMLSTQKEFDFAFSLWSFSHSTHQNLQNLGMEKGGGKIRRALVKFLTESLRLNGSFYLMHFDSLSEEQRISIKQRKRDNPVFSDDEKQSPSKLLIDETLVDLKSKGFVEFSCVHYDGKPLEFSSLEEALEYYTNFHMECHFNNSEIIGEIIDGLSVDLEKHRDKDGVIRIIPGCFIYDIKRVV